ncbi:putative quinol monooxygenase [Microbulbifer pacificus]|uniref:Antibiotic biosynthesis monooxygenase n=1 Tax=Microbulbifer pacificus TaxID=407164 RepID=A0AAU0N1L0_9GAMM|nr:antibiotic biosynthesis monooxygenase [Microbulbifer pacificus]WOX06132.1 antibiotic biosynthesis monooxygenase [Microbulbifer pacificus]
MNKVILEGYIVVPESDLEIVKKELISHIQLTREEFGCEKFNVSQDKNNICRFNVYEEFSNKEAFAYHQQRVKSSHWGKVTKNVERHYQIFEQG